VDKSGGCLASGFGQDTPGRGPGHIHHLPNLFMGEVFHVGQPHGFQFIQTQGNFFKQAHRYPRGFKINHVRVMPHRSRFLWPWHFCSSCLTFGYYEHILKTKRCQIVIPGFPKEPAMKLIISSEGPHATDLIDPRFGRARYLIQFDSSTQSYISLDNSEQVEATQGAGVQAAQKVVDSGADVLLTGHCGPKAFQVLSEADIEIYSGLEGTVLSAVRAWQEGSLKPLKAPDGSARH
jgi:predicted Fe-Mo cluster-binding NifX family protein